MGSIGTTWQRPFYRKIEAFLKKRPKRKQRKRKKLTGLFDKVTIYAMKAKKYS